MALVYREPLITLAFQVTIDYTCMESWGKIEENNTSKNVTDWMNILL